MGSPGPVCGWTYASTKNGEVSFVPGSMSLDLVGVGSISPRAGKSLFVSLPSGNDISGQYRFSEFPASAGDGSAIYDMSVTDSASVPVYIFLLGDGTAGFLTGVAGDLYIGAWTPNNGTHKVDFQIDAFGVPRLFVDDVEITLTFITSGAVPPPIPGPDKISFGAEWSGHLGVSSVITEAFVTSGQLPSTTVYCCP